MILWLLRPLIYLHNRRDLNTAIECMVVFFHIGGKEGRWGRTVVKAADRAVGGEEREGEESSLQAVCSLCPPCVYLNT